jgi:hypothetical protein
LKRLTVGYTREVPKPMSIPEESRRFAGEPSFETPHGARELTMLANGGEIETFLREHDVFGGDPPITLDMVPPHGPERRRGVGQHDPPLPLHELWPGSAALGRELGAASGDIAQRSRRRGSCA